LPAFGKRERECTAFVAPFERRHRKGRSFRPKKKREKKIRGKFGLFPKIVRSAS